MGGLFGGGGGGTNTVQYVPVQSEADKAYEKEQQAKKQAQKDQKSLQNAFGGALSTIANTDITGGKILGDTTMSNGSLLGLNDQLGV